MKEIVITGGNAGIGYETAKELVRQGHRITVTVRSHEKGQDAVQRIRKAFKSADISFVVVDLSNFDSIRTGVKEIKARCPHLDVLIHNAGTFYSARHENEAGIELTFMVNHIAPFYLTHLLLPELVRSPESRIVNVNSDSHFQAIFDAENLNLNRKYHGLRAYGRSKLANVLFTYEFERRNPYEHISIYGVQPGLVNTDIGAKNTGFFQRLIWNLHSRTGKTPEEGADTSIFLATEDRKNLTSGAYWDNRQMKRTSKATYNEGSARILWEKTMEMCGMESYFEAGRR